MVKLYAIRDDKSKDKPALQMVSAWATTNGLVLGQSIVEQKSNEITAIPELLKVLSLSGCIVTIDAIGCQKEIVKQITEQDATDNSRCDGAYKGCRATAATAPPLRRRTRVLDYVITLKKNQGNLYEKVEALFKKALIANFEGFIKSEYKLKDEGHGRQEVRYYQMLSNVAEEIDPDWQWLNLN